MSLNTNKPFFHVRNAFRLLNAFQQRVIDTVLYIKSKTDLQPVGGASGQMLYSNPLSTRSNINIYKDLWGWDFLCGYTFEYYLGEKLFEDRIVAMSIIQLSDDGPYTSKKEGMEKWIDLNSFEPSENSHSYLLFYSNVHSASCKSVGWVSAGENFSKQSRDISLINFLSSPESCEVKKLDNETQILKRYPMEDFLDRQSIDKVIKDFAAILKNETGLKLFKEDYYQ